MQMPVLKRVMSGISTISLIHFSGRCSCSLQQPGAVSFRGVCDNNNESIPPVGLVRLSIIVLTITTEGRHTAVVVDACYCTSTSSNEKEVSELPTSSFDLKLRTKSNADHVDIFSDGRNVESQDSIIVDVLCCRSGIP